MILILDNNEYRRKYVFDKLRLLDHLVASSGISEGAYLTKPLFTVIINPSNLDIKKIKRENTNYLVIKSSKPDNLPSWIDYLPLSNDIVTDIDNYFWDNFQYELLDEISVLGCICIRNNKIALGGKILSVRKLPLRITKFFIYNSQRKFTDTEAASYFRFLTKCPEKNLIDYIYTINGACRKINRPPLIVSYKNTFWLNNDYLRYSLEYCNDCYDEYMTVYKR